MDLLVSPIENQSELRKEIPEGKLAISEIFYSIQGEGKHSGMPMVFIRLNLCNVGCKFCDTMYTWKRITHNRFMSVTEIAEEIERIAPKCKHICFTGGEPFEQEPMLYEVCKALTFKNFEKKERTGLKIHIETSGSCIIDAKFKDVTYWITCSPKRFNGLNYATEVINEVKILVTKNANVEKLRSWVSNFKYRLWVSIQPIEPTPFELGNFVGLSEDEILAIKTLTAQRRRDEEEEWLLNRKRAIDICKQTGWAMSLQIHKYLNIR